MISELRSEFSIFGSFVRAGFTGALDRSCHCLRLAAIAGLIVICALHSSCTGGSGIVIPFIAGITPGTIAAGSGPVTITISGSGFTSTVVVVNGQLIPVNSISGTQLNATIPASLTATPGPLTVMGINTVPSNNIPSNPFTLTVTGTGTGPTLKITKSHTGNFTQGQTGATYTVTVSNISSESSTSGTVTVTEMPPATGLTVTNMTGNNWDCVVTTLTCTRSDALNPGASYDTITVTVSAATNAPSTVTNEVLVSGGGSPNATASDLTNINTPAAPQLALTASSSPSTFAPSGTGSYMVTVSNSGNAPTTGTVTVTITPSSALIPATLSGAGWSCNVTMLTCTNGTPLAAGGSYGMITFDVVIPATPPPPPTVMTSFTASGGGSSSVSTSVSNPT